MPHAAARMATRDEDAGRYQPHRPEQTLLYRIVEEYYQAFTSHLAEQGRELPCYLLIERNHTNFTKLKFLLAALLCLLCARSILLP